jgi:hypothetical protein
VGGSCSQEVLKKAIEDEEANDMNEQVLGIPNHVSLSSRRDIRPMGGFA